MAGVACETTQATSALPTPAACANRTLPHNHAPHTLPPLLYPFSSRLCVGQTEGSSGTHKAAALFWGCGVPGGAMGPREPRLPEGTVLPLPHFPHFPAIGCSGCRCGGGGSAGASPFLKSTVSHRLISPSRHGIAGRGRWRGRQSRGGGAQHHPDPQDAHARQGKARGLSATGLRDRAAAPAPHHAQLSSPAPGLPRE